MMEILFINAAGDVLFSRNDMESGHWVQEEMTVNADFPFVPDKVIERGQRIVFDSNVFEIRSVSTSEPDHYQQIIAEHIAIAELQDEHLNNGKITNKTASQALTSVLTGTLWEVGTDTSSGTQSADISRGSVWQGVCTIQQNWNVYITPRIVFTDGAITGRYLDIAPAQGNWNGVRLSIRKNFVDPIVTYNDEDVLTALYGYGAMNNNSELTFKNVSWSQTSDHPAKPSGQTYLEWPEKTALYGRSGRPRYGYYQNASITNANTLLEKTWEALKRTCDPKISISGTVADLYRLGYEDQPLKLHDLAIVEIEETGETYYKEITRLDVDLVDPSATSVNLGDYIPNIIYINRDIAKKASSGGRGGGAGNTGEDNLYNTFYEYQARTDKNGSMIGMVVGETSGGYYVKAGQIVLSINGQSGTYALIQADKVNLDGYVTASMLESAFADVDQISVSQLTISGYLTCLGYNTTWQEQEVVTGISTSREYGRWVYADAGGNIAGNYPTNMVTSVSKTTKTIHYLGR